MVAPTVPDRRPPTQVDASLRWLAGVLLLCLMAVLGVRWVFAGMEDDLRQRGANERARLFVGEEIVRGIQGVEKDIYRMAATQNAAGFARILRDVDQQLDKLIQDLNVLKFGGTSRRQLQLNIGEHDEVTREMTYHPDEQSRKLVMELIEIGPHLGRIRDRVDELERLLTLRWQASEQEDRARFFDVEEDIATLLKQVPPYFQRLTENANRLFLDGDERLRALEAELQERRHGLKLLETALIALVIVFGSIAMIRFLRQLGQALDEARRARNENERQRAQIATMLDTLSDGVYATDMSGRITFINAVAERVLGWPAKELVGRQAHQTFHHTRPDGESFPAEQCPLLTVLSQGASLHGEDHFVGHDGRFIPVSYRSKPLMQEQNMVGSLVSFQDITERHESEALIRLQRAALDAAVNMIVITDREGRIEYVNAAFCNATGYSADEVTGARTSTFRSGLHDAAFYQAMWNNLLAGRPWEGELVNRRKDGSFYPEQMTITPISENGVISHFVAIKRDISEEARTRTRLKLVEAAIRETDQGILITDAEPNEEGPTIQYVNPAFSRISGYEADEAIGQRTAILRGAETDRAQSAMLKEALAAGNSFSFEMNYHRKDGSPYIAELHYSPVRDEHGLAAHYIALLSDVSERKAAEEAMRGAHDRALEHSRLKSEFLSTMSHEIRTPMNGIMGMTDLLLDTSLTAEQREFAGIVRDSAHSLLTIIDDILDFSKIEAGKLDIEITDLSPVRVVEGVAELLAAKAREKKLSLMSFVDPALPSRVRGDPTRLRQVLLNLAGNAVKFTNQGGIEIAALRTTTNGKGTLRFEVRDTGIGIPAAVQARLFQSFTQADSSTTRKYGGTGLGLAISKRLVELMGGEIGVTSDEGLGATFWFTLPLSEAAAAPAEDDRACRKPPGAIALRVLVVDDHPIDRDVLRRYLRSWGFGNDCARNAGEALTLMRSAAAEGAPYDVALIDFAMPGMDGTELATAIRADGTLTETRLVLLTAFNTRDLFDRALAGGFSVCLAKPVRQSQLFDCLVSAPAAVAEPGQAEAISDTGQAAPSLHNALENNRLVLLAEDNVVNQRVAQVLLNKLGYAVHVVGNGQDAVDAVAALPYAAILMDCQMPVMDGFEATAAIRKGERLATRHIPIIAMTANAMQGDRERCLAAGMDDYVAKPIGAESLQNALSRWVAQSADITPTVTRGLVDFERLRSYLGDDPEGLAELLDVFRTATDTLLCKLRTASDGRDAATVRILAHEAKGSCGNLGIEGMARLAEDIERAAVATDWPTVDALLLALENAFAQVLDAIERHGAGPAA